MALCRELQRPLRATMQHPGISQRKVGLHYTRNDELLKISEKTDMIRSLI